MTEEERGGTRRWTNLRVITPCRDTMSRHHRQPRLLHEGSCCVRAAAIYRRFEMHSRSLTWRQDRAADQPGPPVHERSPAQTKGRRQQLPVAILDGLSSADTESMCVWRKRASGRGRFPGSLPRRLALIRSTSYWWCCVWVPRASGTVWGVKNRSPFVQ